MPFFRFGDLNRPFWKKAIREDVRANGRIGIRLDRQTAGSSVQKVGIQDIARNIEGQLAGARRADCHSPRRAREDGLPIGGPSDVGAAIPPVQRAGVPCASAACAIHAPSELAEGRVSDEGEGRGEKEARSFQLSGGMWVGRRERTWAP